MKSQFPYLVDLSITDFCDKHCPWCYRNSESFEENKHASQSYIFLLADILKESLVFDIVIGGGEPTLYKSKYASLSHILGHFYDNKFNVSLTTKNFLWHKDKDFKRSVEKLHSVAISVASLDDIKKAKILSKHITKNASHVVNISCQIILGVVPYDEFKKMINSLKRTGFNISIVGYKNTGRGNSFTPHVYDKEWVKLIKSSRLFVSVDSVIVKDWKQELLNSDVNEIVLTGSEGEQTCFIDAVNQKICPSSFSDQLFDFPISYKTKKDDFLKVYQSF